MHIVSGVLLLPVRDIMRRSNRLQHAWHIMKMLEDLDPQGKDIDVLSSDEGFIVDEARQQLCCKRSLA